MNFHGEQRSNATHESTTDPESRLAKKAKGKEAKLSYTGHVLMENRNGLIVTTRVTKATGTAESEAALEMAEEVSGDRRVTLGGDKGYDQKKLVARSGRGAAPSTNEPRGMRDTRSVRECANGWKRSSAG